MNITQLTEPLPEPVSPFFFLARYLERQNYPDEATLKDAQDKRDKLIKLAAKHPEFKTDDAQLALLIAGCAVNDEQRKTIMSLCSSQEALDLVWAL